MAANSYNARRLVWVTPFTGSPTKYGFMTNVLAAVGTDCGHNEVTGDFPTGLVIGANAPKPGRATKRGTTGTGGSFYDIANRASLKAAGYSTTAPRIRRGGAGANSRAVYVDLDGVRYAWRMPQTTFANVSGVLSDLGITECTGAEVNLVWGASYPKPPKASTTITGAGGVNTISTFIDPASLSGLPDGWSTSSGEEYFGAAGA